MTMGRARKVLIKARGTSLRVACAMKMHERLNREHFTFLRVYALRVEPLVLLDKSQSGSRVGCDATLRFREKLHFTRRRRTFKRLRRGRLNRRARPTNVRARRDRRPCVRALADRCLVASRNRIDDRRNQTGIDRHCKLVPMD